jgi:amino acid adenylation domain-containing protein
VQTANGATTTITLSPHLTAALKAFSRQEGVTLFMTLLAGFQTLLARYSGQDDICTGTAIANRTRAEIEGLIGFFVNTLVLRIDLSGDPSVRDVLMRVREVTLGTYAHQDLPFEMLVEAIQPQRDLSHTPLFQVMLVLTNTPMTTLELPELTVTPLDIETGMATFDMTLSLTEIPEGLVGTVQYNTDLFDARTIEDMMVHFQVLLEAVVANPEQCISVLPLLTPAERQRILVDWNQTAAPFPDSACIHHLIGNWVAVQPAAPALVFDDQIISYAEMSQRANQLAHSLQAMGAAPDTIVALCLDRSPQMVIGLLAILTAGAAYLPLDPAYPPDRLAFMIDDAQAPILVTDHDHRPLLPAFRGHTIALDRDGPAIAHQPTHPPASPVSAANLAYVIYTSGSTGKPKGALLQHRGLVNLAAWQQRAFHITPDSRILQFSPLSFDASVWEIVMALANGATLVLARRETLADGLSLLHLLRSARISHVTLPPSVLSVLPQEHLPDLTTIIAAGEACPRRLVQLWGHNRQFVNAYGPTETTVCAAMAVCSPDDPTAPPIGRPIANTRLYVLDAHLQPTPIGVPGQLCVAGVSLARGYHNRPDLTADRFIPDPFCTTPGARLYKTGDIVRYRPDGQLDFLGRADAQVKVRGFRIELGEIEAALRQIPGVRDAAVVVRDVAGDKRLAAYLVPHTMPGPSQESVHAHLQASLPDYMIPAAIVVLERWPLSPAGKIDRRALPAPEGLGGERVYVGPRTAVEERLAELCATLLGVERVGVEDSFFELGGHSLLATQLMARVRDAWQVEIPLRTLFERPTIAGLAEAIEQARPVASRDLDKIAQALAAVQALSDAQTKGMLAPEQRPGVQQ